ncbi:MAG TPA: hypothetical protein VG963_30555 [Polyangiaceae bacterium]|nr:hypothetical protein [Polyangiaceae bacterium]
MWIGMRGGAAIASVVAALCLAVAAHALDASAARSQAEQLLGRIQTDAASLGNPDSARERPSHPPEKLIASGELSLRGKDYEQAIDTSSQVIELFRQGKADRNAHADGLFLLGEAYFGSGQLLSARREYSELLDLANQPPYDIYAGRSLARLVDVALNTGQRDALEPLERQAARLAARDASGALDYGRGKLSFAKGDFAAALARLGAVGADSPYFHQCQYVIGAVLLREALGAGFAGAPSEGQARLVGAASSERLSPAVSQFRRVTELPADTDAHRQVIDDAWLAIGRLYYETDAYRDAAAAYTRIKRTSPVYYEMLFELAWVYIRVGDYARSERALEILSVAAPDTLDVADGALLRADLMLRSGRFDRALEAYTKIRERFDPARQRVDDLLRSNTEPAAYYDRLVEDPIEVSRSSKLPGAVLDWVRQEARGERVFALIDDVAHAREILRRSRRLETKLRTVLSAPSRARAFPALEAELKKTHGLINQIARARRLVALGLDDQEAQPVSGELEAVRAERRQLMNYVAAAPVTASEFALREDRDSESWNRVSQALQRETLEADRLQAIINGLRRVLDEPDKHGVTRDPGSRARFQAQVEENERDLALYRAHIDAYRQEIENGRIQVGFGDRRYGEDEQVRRRFREVLEREVVLLAQGSGGSNQVAFSRSVIPLLENARGLEQKLEQNLAALQARVAAGADQLQHLLEEESANLDNDTRRLDALDQSARQLAGEVALKNFAGVRDRLRSIVLRADVGVVQQAWQVREEQLNRLQKLQRQRAVEEQNLDDELREVLDEAGDP